MTLSELAGTTWQGTAELWTDPLGNEAQTSACTLRIDADGLRYTWQYEGQPQQGRITTDGDGGTFTDSWHSTTPVRCAPVAGSAALIDLLGSYRAGSGPSWGWRLILSLRPPYGGAAESLVLQMTNITPWGEEARAVRMVGARHDG